jgi:nitroreductase
MLIWALSDPWLACGQCVIMIDISAMAAPAIPSLAGKRARTVRGEVDWQFVERWSSRSFLPDALEPSVVAALFEAARWAPSASNLQPWLFVYADDEERLARLRPIVRDGNRRWADRAPLLVVVFARKNNPESGEPNRLASFDAGAAWMSLALQATRLGLVAHAMGGIHPDRAHETLGVPQDEFQCLCAVAVGRRGPREALPDDLQAREVPSDRKPAHEIAHRGVYRAQ